MLVTAFMLSVPLSISAGTNTNVYIDGQKQSYKQMPINQNGSTLVPLRGIFESLGATVEWDGTTQTVSAQKGDTFIKLQVGQKIGLVNGKSVGLSVAAQTINGSTMVPLRFVSEALGAQVNWNANTSTVTISSDGTSKPSKETVIGGIKVRYGNHTYGSVNQDQYDQVMSIIDKALDDAESIEFGGNYADAFKKYLETYPNWDKSDKALAFADRQLGPLLRAGLSQQDAEWLNKLSVEAALLAQQKSPGQDGSPRSAYDELVRKVGDCDSTAQAHSALYDAAGYSTAIIAGKGHADMYVKINGKWYTQMGGEFVYRTDKLTLNSGSWFISSPTF